ncbi:hypothetical protein SAV31267_001150 [Streptomyces avermitilis]|uniref:Mycothiol-dependent maleylpyruvate isomerase metal-binding domain-containing protein n=1 Tax=Streptomyces avermitilis TaxID=33903 RepID=A0A4D4MFB5_STRAX|nr:hypothetical protein SAV31267_001150 [Streptomyces avermitilis]
MAGQDVRGILPEGLGAAVRDTAEEIAALLRGGADMGRGVPGSQWTVGQAAAHLAQAGELMADIAAGRARSWGTARRRALPRPMSGRSPRSASGGPSRWPR